MKQGFPKFHFKCIWCLKCIYACPRKALSPSILKFSVLKNGYNLKEMSERAQLQQQVKNDYAKDRLWQGVIDYLKE
jgi:succinate dehydrogenase/fumarate reductase-like Fe-S protein